MAKAIDLTGQRFGRLVARHLVNRTPKHSYWQCVCDCGESPICILNNLRRGLTASCGCVNREDMKTRFITHDMSHSTEYSIWANMLNRCRNKDVPAFPNYGGRGIKVCPRWHDFSNFLTDMGPRPEGRTLDRHPNNDGDYEPSNCRWATRLEQANNTRRNRIVAVGSDHMTLANACRHVGLSRALVVHRIYRGWPESHWFAPRGTKRPASIKE